MVTFSGPRCGLAAAVVVISGSLIATAQPVTTQPAQTRPARSQPTAERPLQVRIDRDYPPYEFAAGGRPTGFNVELFAAVAEVMGIEYEISAVPWTEARRTLEDGSIDVLLGMYRSREREQFAGFSTPHTIIHHAIFVREGSRIGSLDDLKDKEIIVEDGDIMHDLAKSRRLGREIITVPSMAEGLRLLASGRHDCLLAPKLMGLFLTEKFDLANVVPVGPPIEPRRYCFAVPKGRAALLARLNEGLAITRATGKYQELYDKWFGVLEPRGVPLRTVLIYGAVTFGVLALLLTASLVWSRTLKRRVAEKTQELNQELVERRRVETDLRRVQQELESANNRLAGIIEGTTDLIAALDRDFRIIAFNSAYRREFEAIFGRRIELDMNLIDALAHLPADREKAMQLWSRALEGEEYSVVEELGDETRARKYYEITYSPIREPAHGGVIGAAHILRDVTARKRAEQALQESESRFRELFSNMSSGVAIYEAVDEGRDFVFVDLNCAGERISNVSRDEIVGRRLSETFPGAASLGLVELLRQVWRTGEPRRLPAAHYRDDRHDLWVENYVCRLPSGHVVAVYDDISDRVRAEEALAQFNRALEVKNREMETLVYVTSHDLRSPLVNVLGFSRELQKACQDLTEALDQTDLQGELRDRVLGLIQADIPEAVGYIQAGARKMDSLLAGLLRLSRLGRAALNLEPLDMNAMLDNIARSMEYQLKEAEARLEIDDLPPCLGDAVQINQVFSNLLDNALKYRDPARNCVIRVTGSRDGDRAVYGVEDNGVGIAPEHQERVFEVFRRLNPDVGPGEGLGLTAAQRIVERHGGRISLESVPGRGSVLTVVLPGIPEQGLVAGSNQGRIP